MPVEIYALTCDDASRELGNHAEMVRMVLDEYEGRSWLYPREAATELSALFVPQAFKNRKLWRPAMSAVLERLAAQNGDTHVCILEAVPLETAWRRKTLAAIEWERTREKIEPQAEKTQDLDSGEREEQFAARRSTALQALYKRELGFEPLLDSWMARMVDPFHRRG